MRRSAVSVAFGEVENRFHVEDRQDRLVEPVKSTGQPRPRRTEARFRRSPRRYEHVDRIAANLGRVDYIVRRAGDLNVERLFDDVDDSSTSRPMESSPMEITRMGCVAFVRTTSGEAASTGTRLP